MRARRPRSPVAVFVRAGRSGSWRVAGLGVDASVRGNDAPIGGGNDPRRLLLPRPAATAADGPAPLPLLCLQRADPACRRMRRPPGDCRRRRRFAPGRARPVVPSGKPGGIGTRGFGPGAPGVAGRGGPAAVESIPRILARAVRRRRTQTRRGGAVFCAGLRECVPMRMAGAEDGGWFFPTYAPPAQGARLSAGEAGRKKDARHAGPPVQKRHGVGISGGTCRSGPEVRLPRACRVGAPPRRADAPPGRASVPRGGRAPDRPGPTGPDAACAGAFWKRRIRQPRAKDKKGRWGWRDRAPATRAIRHP